MTIKTEELIEQIKKLVDTTDFSTSIPVNEIVGIDHTGELVYLETISLYKYLDTPTLDVRGMTFRNITVGEVEERRSEYWAEEERDIWAEACRCGYTDKGLYEWWEECCDEAEACGQLYPYDDDSYREEFEYKYKELPKDLKDKIEEVWGVKGDLDSDLSEEVNRNSDWLTVYCGSIGRCVDTGHYVGSPETCTEAVEQWELNLYPELINFIAKLQDDL